MTEKGLYKVLFKCRKPIAQTFQNWVCDVIKEIRLSGTYTLQQKLEEKEKENQELHKIEIKIWDCQTTYQTIPNDASIISWSN